jgi:hypothetical protein
VWRWIKRDRKNSRRHVILHYHIFKNAGSTVRSILEQNFGPRFASVESEHPDDSVSNDTLLRLLELRPDIAAVSSHGLRPPKPENGCFVFHDIVYFRHPLTRLSSMYDFYRRQDGSQDPLTMEAKKRNLADFFRVLVDEYPHHAMNPQVAYLANGATKIPIPSDLTRAEQLASQFDILGVTDLFDLAAVAAEYLLRGSFNRQTVLKKFDFSYAAENVSSDRPTDLDVELQRLKEACGDSLFERLRDLNALDIALVESARRECYRRFQLVPDHQRQLKNLSCRSVARERDVAMVVLASNHPHDFLRYAR